MKDTRPGILILIGTVLFVLVIFGVYVMMTLQSTLSSQQLDLLSPFTPFVVLTGFFIFIIAAILFATGVISVLRKG